MTIIAGINVALSIIGLLTIFYTLARSHPARRCDALIGDMLVILAYLLILNTEWLTANTYLTLFAGDRGWHLFVMVVLINVLVHTFLPARQRGDS